METHLGHVVFGVAAEHQSFYKELLEFLGWGLIYDSPDMCGLGDKIHTSMWFGRPPKSHVNDYDGAGVNHVGIHTALLADVDAAAVYLRGRGVVMLFDTPRHRPEFAGAGTTYYQIMFESPDRILFEIVYTGPYTE